MAAVAIVTIATCGCSFSYNLGSLIGKDDALPAPPAIAPQPIATSGAPLTPARATQAATALPTESDLAQARLAVADALSKAGSTRSTPWENPATGARGTITPINAANPTENTSSCRDFLASYVRDGNETWLEGQACRGSGGRWKVQRLTPWKQA